MLTKEQFYNYLGYIEAAMAHDERTTGFIETVHEIIGLVEEASCEDFYGTQGYEYRLGWCD